MKRETLYKKPLKVLYKLAQKYFNKEIRIRDQKWRGHCITCTGPVQEAGHFNHGGNKGMTFWVDFNRKNMNGQCTHCNHFLSGNLGIYSEKLEEEYPHGIIQELNSLSYKQDPWTKDDLIDIIENSKENIKKLLTMH